MLAPQGASELKREYQTELNIEDDPKRYPQHTPELDSELDWYYILITLS